MASSSNRYAKRPSLTEAMEETGLSREEILSHARAPMTKHEWKKYGVPTNALRKIRLEQKSHGGTIRQETPEPREGHQVLIDRCVILLRRLEAEKRYDKIVLTIRNLEGYLGIEPKDQFEPSEDKSPTLSAKS